MKLFSYLLFVILVALLPVGSAAQATQSRSTQAPSAPSPAAKKPAATAASTPSSQDIAEAKAKGLVWANENTKVYHKEGRLYGTTKQGKFMTEADAQKAGYHLAKTSGGSKKAQTTATSTTK
jgi:hypothetical protein